MSYLSVAADRWAGQPLPRDEIFWTSKLGHYTFQARPVHRSTLFKVFLDSDEPTPFEIDTIFGERNFVSADVTFARLSDISIDDQLSVCVDRSGQVLKETASIAESIDPGLETARVLWPKASRQTIDEPVIHCFHRASPAYGHFIFDCLAPILLWRDVILSGRAKILLPSYFPAWGQRILSAVGFDVASHVTVIRKDVAVCRNVIMSTTIDTRNCFRPSPEICRFLTNPLAAIFPSSAKMIYLTRRNQTTYSNRTISNEDDVILALVRLGFMIVEPGNIPFEDQVSLFRGAEIIVAAHGSAFGNLPFARPGSTLIDLMPTKYIGHWPSRNYGAERWALNLTTLLQLNYLLVFCQSNTLTAKTKGASNPIVSTIDIDVLERAIETARAFSYPA